MDSLAAPTIPRWLAAVLALVSLSHPSQGQCEVDRLRPRSPVAGFGANIAVEGNLAVMGAPGDFGDGKAHVFRHDGLRWREEQELLAGNGLIAFDCALSGNTILIGGSFFDRTAYAFVHDGTRWNLQQALGAPGSEATDAFGTRVRLDGDTAVVSAQLEDTATARDSGAAYVFVRSGTAWSLQQRLAPNDAAEFDTTGPCAIAGDEILLGSPGKRAVYVFRRAGAVWTQVQKLTSSNDSRSFGRRIARDGDRAVIASFEDDFSGAAFVFEKQGGLWVERQKLIASDRRQSAIFGFSLDLSGDALVIGSDRPVSSGPIAPYLFRRQASGWAESARLTPSVPPRRDAAEVAIDGNKILVGGHGSDEVVLDFRLLDGSLQSFNGRGVNADVLVTSAAATGQPWSAAISVVAPRGPGSAYVLVTDRCQSGVLVGRRAEYLLAGRPLLLLGPVPHTGQGSLVPFATSVPVTPAFLGHQWAAQGIVWDGTLGLTNAIASVVR